MRVEEARHNVNLTSDAGTDMVDGLMQDRALLARFSTAEKVAEVLRTRIMEGFFPPGSRLPEETIASGLTISRNTLREAFRLLNHERLLVHKLNRGVFVCVPTVADLVDLYRVRRILEISGAKVVSAAPLSCLHAIRDSVERGQTAANEGRWQDVGTANLSFHRAIAALAGSSRIDELMRKLLAELRLVFHVMADPERFHAPYLDRHWELAQLLDERNGEAAAKALLVYLDEAEHQLLDAYQKLNKEGTAPPSRLTSHLTSAPLETP